VINLKVQVLRRIDYEVVLAIMANLLRTAKSSSNWTAHELEAYNIVIVPQNKVQFFGTDELPDPTEPSLLGFQVMESHETMVTLPRQARLGDGSKSGVRSRQPP
jgi:hypothetical protein